MATLESLENAVSSLSKTDLARFRTWFLEFDSVAWDARIESDAIAGKFDRFAQDGLEDYVRGTAREL
jgi:hypothetical protein